MRTRGLEGGTCPGQNFVYTQLGNKGSHLIQQMKDKLVEHKQYIAEHGVDLPEIAEWE
ncbi:MAG: hypothetical protein Q4E12_04410 [Coriobacteriia bacterium]|nr:hypothetical protein [Coriobacteriia bacterium]